MVLLDVDLPGLDGLGVLRLLARERMLERTRVIMLTVRTHEAEVVRALELGAFDHVSQAVQRPRAPAAHPPRAQGVMDAMMLHSAHAPE